MTRSSKCIEDNRDTIALVYMQMCDKYDEVAKSFKRGKDMITKVTVYVDIFLMLKKMSLEKNASIILNMKQSRTEWYNI